ncbi:GGDEF domain-containing protein [Catenovulum sp. 2E275]|uniref:GGDEF domain-containing protein n=1 Tax=Catenovulum sp. 2E275 TaxID=2980497 RepID=UPI0021D01AAA|nr:GGDEF domain-containing protein [Catenovulum sp. 2E275]MCU4676929.1 GGDEF domain-containing protein [Catenovulum sp. 2E275]
MQNKFSFKKILPWAAFPLTGLMLLLYPMLPEQKLIIHPSQETFGLLYSGAENTTNNEKPNIFWHKDISTWQCDTLNINNYQYCGINLLWREQQFQNGRDLSGFTKLNIHLKYNGNAESFKLFVRNADPAYATKEDGNSGQYNFTMLQKRHINNESIHIDLNEFTVADWWMAQYNHPRKFAKPSFKYVTSIGIDFSGNQYRGDTHIVELNQITLTGPLISKSNYYLIILIIWMLSVFCYLVISLIMEKNKRAMLKLKNKTLKQQSEEYKSQSHYDVLTSQLNRRGFEYQLTQGLQQQLRYNYLLLIDLDHFKKVNDNYGHSAGDVVLQTVAKLLKDNLREDDLFARWGGEEFIVCITTDNIDNALLLAEKLRKAISHLTLDSIEQSPITTSIGIANWLEHETFDSVFERCDKKLYLAKAEGRNKVCY